ncbi:recombination directionality factor [Streptomyces sp. NBRC 110465]|uniref:recombination directionality factor n=1 Tax=Streptomyces sp. NBRC 110465 TaxID=1897621 RepID=UPI000932DF08|nr:hypothetical protein [Streptomyces sp. NBRC 110465]
MAGRLLNLQRQAAELGRLRTGWSVPTDKGRNRPVKSETWIVSSHDRSRVDAAAEMWGGKVERWSPQGNHPDQWRVITEATTIEALLPPGDPLSQYNEMWTGGGCARRCDGITEQLSKKPCICLDRHGENWYLLGPQQVCRATSRIKVYLPDLPGIGVWRAETHGFYAANEWPGVVDMVLSGTGGRGVIPVGMRIEQRQRIAEGKTKKFPVVVVEVRATARQALTGTIPGAELSPVPPAHLALEAASRDYAAEARKASTADAALKIYREAEAAGDMTDELKAELIAIGTAKRAAEAKAANSTKTGGKNMNAANAAEEEPIDAEIVEDDDPEAVWFEIVSEAGERGWSADQLAGQFAARNGGLAPDSAEATQLRRFLADLRETAA